MLNQQNYKKMNNNTIERINNFIEEHEIDVLEKYYIVRHTENFTVLRIPDTGLKIFLIGEKAYREKVPVFPVFSLYEIKEALMQRKQ